MAIEFLMWGTGAAVLGLSLGNIAYSRSKLAFIIIIALLGLVSIGIVEIMEITGGDLNAFTQMGRAGLDQTFSGTISRITSAINQAGSLPQHIKVSFLVFLAAFFLARIAAWRRGKRRRKPGEKESQRRKRILKDFGMRTMKDVRKLY